MTNDLKSIATQIDCLARLTGAPGTFVEQVRQLFVNKGISLEEDATPYVPALEQAFRREETIRNNTRSARQNLEEAKERFEEVGGTYRKQIEQLKRVRASLQKAARKIPIRESGARQKSKRVLIATKRPTVVTKQQRDRNYPMVPGPKENPVTGRPSAAWRARRRSAAHLPRPDPERRHRTTG